MRAKYNKEDIIAQGANLFRKKGYHHVGINEILKACEIPKGSFYNFFDSKEDFVIQTLGWYGERQQAYIKHMLKPENGSPLERLKFFYKNLINENEQDGLDAGCLVNNIAIEVAGLNDQVGDEAYQQFQDWMAIISQTVEAGQEVNEIRKDFSAEQIAEYLHTGLYGVFPLMKSQKSRQPLDLWFSMAFTFIQA